MHLLSMSALIVSLGTTASTVLAQEQNTHGVVDSARTEWNIGELSEVKMFVQNSNHYALDTAEGAAEWEALVPSDSGIIHVPSRAEPLTISMFHQLRCLDNIRAAVVDALQNQTVPDPVTIHCMNYIRQMVLCRADLYLESVRDPEALHAVDMMGVRTCKDWSRMYEEAENQKKSMVL